MVPVCAPLTGVCRFHLDGHFFPEHETAFPKFDNATWYKNYLQELIDAEDDANSTNSSSSSDTADNSTVVNATSTRNLIQVVDGTNCGGAEENVELFTGNIFENTGS